MPQAVEGRRSGPSSASFGHKGEGGRGPLRPARGMLHPRRPVFARVTGAGTGPCDILGLGRPVLVG
jgi:hypothetical protein